MRAQHEQQSSRSTGPVPPQHSGSGSSGPAVKWIIAAIVIIVSILVVVGIRKNSASRQQQQSAQTGTAATLARGVAERRELGVSPQATHAEIWAAARTQPLERMQLCAGSDTVVVAHNMGTDGQASVNGTPITLGSNGYQVISIPSDAVAVQVSGLSGEGGEVLFVLDTFPNQKLADIGTTRNTCDLKETHNLVALKVGEIATIRIVH